MDAVIYKKLSDTLNSDTDGNLKISLSNVDSVTTVHHDNTDSTGDQNGIVANINGLRTASISGVSSESVVDVHIELSIDGTNWYYKQMFYIFPTSHQQFSDGHADGIDIAGYKYMRVVIDTTGYTGTVYIISNAIY